MLKSPLNGKALQELKSRVGENEGEKRNILSLLSPQGHTDHEKADKKET